MSTRTFCVSCGALQVGDGPRCQNCGAARVAPSAKVAEPPFVQAMNEPDVERELWKGSPDRVAAPRTSVTTKYRLTTQRLTIEHGMLGKSMVQIPLFRIKDIEVHKGITQRARGVGEIAVISTDPLMSAIKLGPIGGVDQVAELLRRAVLEARRTSRVYVSESM